MPDVLHFARGDILLWWGSRRCLAVCEGCWKREFSERLNGRKPWARGALLGLLRNGRYRAVDDGLQKEDKAGMGLSQCGQFFGCAIILEGRQHGGLHLQRVDGVAMEWNVLRHHWRIPGSR